MEREVKFTEALLEATTQLLESDPSIFLMGQDIADPKGFYGTTLGLQERFGSERVMNTPLSENTVTGIAIGAAIEGMRPILTFKRADLLLLAFDQLINNAAKWNYMFGDQMKVPLVIRLVIGRGWGQGPQHSQSLHGLFASIPGLKVVMPSTPYDAKGLLIAATKDNNPVLFLEHRWLHALHGPVPEESYEVPIGKAKVIQVGTDLTLVTCSHMVIEGRKACKILADHGVSVEHIDLRSVKPLDRETLIKSVRKTGRLLVADPDWKSCGVAAEVIASLSEEAFNDFKAPPSRVTYPDRHSPSSWALANHYYPTARVIAMEAFRSMRLPSKAQQMLEQLLDHRSSAPLDTPDVTFTGPF
ncbi:MAG: Acetoin:2,6-dichlorophenolindophenol oxidoreductase subunit beta [Chlamydiae bacterium]|nr:Acetoin:2,6-dichlorophenolindophenol oxidoreductase subunit beta [Chlamydiota bacterium]